MRLNGVAMPRGSVRAALLGGALVAALGWGGARAADPGAYLAARQADAAGDAVAAADRYVEALARDPENLAMIEAAALNLMAAGRIAAAAEAAAPLLAVEPGHRIGNLALVVDAVARGDFAAASERLAAQADGFHPLTAALLAAWAAHGAGDGAAAMAALDALETPPLFQLFGRYHAGLLKQAQGDAAAALAAFEAAAAQASGPSTRLSLAHGAALEAAGRVEDARDLYARTTAQARRGDPAMDAALARLDRGEPAEPLVTTAAQGAAEALFAVATALSGEGGRRFALAHAQAAVHLWPELAAGWMLIAELHEADGLNEQALEAYGRVAPEAALWSRAQIGRAGALAALDRTDAGVEALRAVVARFPQAGDAQLALADLLRQQERFEEAAGVYSAALAIEDAAGRADWTLYYQRGIAYERAGRWPEAEADFKKALALEPEQPLVLNYLGYSWVEMRMHLDEAKAMIERAVELRPEDGYITDSLGWVLYRLGDYDGAVEWLEKAVALAPVDPVINDHLGDALWMVGRRLEAEFQWRRARSLDPEPEDLARIRRKLAVGLDAVLAEEAAQATPAAASQGGDGN
jgi:tetratricopeptide (TPR) repeat protein